MKNYKFCLSTDTSADEFKSHYKAHSIFFLPMTYIENGVEYQDYFDSDEEYTNFFNGIRQGKKFSTSGVNSQLATEYFEKILADEKKDIVHIALSSGLSLTYDACKAAADAINTTSEFKVYVIDSRAGCQGQNLLLIKSETYRDSGMEAVEAVELIENIKNRIHHWFFVSDLSHLKRGGRISGLAAFVGNLLQLKPIITVSTEGKAVLFEKHIGVKKSMQAIVAKLDKYFDRDESLGVLIIPHANNIELANELHKQILALNLNVKILIKCIGPVMGCHIGADAAGVMFIGNENKYTKK